jgi:hypothetical protein
MGALMINPNVKFVAILISFIALIMSGCDVRLPTVEGPESDDLLSKLHGYIIMERPKGGIIAIALPSDKEMTIRKPWEKSNPVEALGGPDNQGRIAFIDSDLGATRYSLKVIDMKTGKEIEVFTRHGSSWPHEEQNYGKSFSFSHNGGLVAFIINYKNDFSLIPNDYVNVGQLEIVNTEKRNIIRTDVKAMDKGMDWLHDLKKLVYVALIPKDKIDHQLAMKFNDDFGNEMTTWHSLPVISLLSLADMSTKQLHIGWNPIVSRDGSSILVQDYKGRIRIYRISYGDSISVNLPAAKEAHVFSFIGQDVLLYKGLPTEGSKQEFRLTSTFGTTPYWTLKVAQLKTLEFKTVVQYLDIHRRVSFGEVGDTDNTKMK